jgi:hypothetical protein
MKKIFKTIIYFLILCFQITVFGQNTIELPPHYYFDRSNPIVAPILIRKLVNPKLHSSMNNDSIQKLDRNSQDEYYKKLWESESVTLKSGNYHCLNVNNIEMSFTINENGFLNGEATYFDLNEKDYITTIIFDNGFLKHSKTEIISKDQLYSQVEVKDSIQTLLTFYPSGKLKMKEIEDFKIKIYQQNIVTTKYYEDGKVSVEDDKINKTFKFFNSNGKLERITDDKNGFGKYFDKNGIMERQYYRKGDEKCEENYDNGKLTGKVCDNTIVRKESF